jgi:hypothetical protein
MVRFTLNYKISSQSSVSLMKDDTTTILYAKIQQPLCHTDVHSYEWNMSLSHDTIIVSFGKTKWSYSVEEVKLAKTVTLCTAPTAIACGMTTTEAVVHSSCVLFLLLVCCVVTMAVTAGVIAEAPWDYQKIYDRAIDHYMVLNPPRAPREPTIFYSLGKGAQMHNGDKLCDQKRGKCVVLDQCNIHIEGDTSKNFPFWGDNDATECTLKMQNNGILEMRQHEKTILQSSGTPECTYLAFIAGALVLDCGEFWKLSN